EKQDLESGKNLAQRRAESETVDSFSFELGQKKIAALMASRPIHCRGIAGNDVTKVRRVVLHHLHQRITHFGIAVHNEQLHYCGGAVLGAGKRVKSLVDRKSTRLNSSHLGISYAVFCLKKKSN